MWCGYSDRDLQPKAIFVHHFISFVSGETAVADGAASSSVCPFSQSNLIRQRD